MRLLALTILFSLFAFAQQDNPAGFDELAARAAAARDRNDLAEAIDLYRRALSLNPSWQEGWWFLGSLSYDSDKFSAGQEALRHFVQLNPAAGPGWALLGLCEFETGDYSDSLAHIERSLSLRVDNAQMTSVLLYHEAVLLAHDGQFDQSLQKYAQLIKSAPTGPEVLLGLGLAASHQTMLPKDVPPAGRDLLSLIGKAGFYTVAGKLEEAQRSYAELLEKYPESSAVHYTYGVFLLTADPARATSELQRAVELAPGNAAAFAMLAWISLQKDDPASALIYAQKACAGDPKSPLAQLVLGRSLVESGELNRGIGHLETAAKLDPADLENHLALATAYSKAGRKHDAWTERRESMKMASEKAEVARP